MSAFSDNDKVLTLGIRYSSGFYGLKLFYEAHSIACIHWISVLYFALDGGTSESHLGCRVHTTTMVCVRTSLPLMSCSAMEGVVKTIMSVGLAYR